MPTHWQAGAEGMVWDVIAAARASPGAVRKRNRACELNPRAEEERRKLVLGNLKHSIHVKRRTTCFLSFLGRAPVNSSRKFGNAF